MAKPAREVLAEKFHQHHAKIKQWYQEKARIAPPPFYCSTDLRDSGYKIAPVDCNLYPAGFNNICSEDLKAASGTFQRNVELWMKRLNLSSVKKVLIIPENHTQNAYYIENLDYLSRFIEKAGYEVRLGWYTSDPLPPNSLPIQLVSATNKTLQAFPIEIQDGVLSAGGFTPDFVVLNNDFSGGYPQPLDEVKQPIQPTHALGWHSRKKSDHFRFYNELAAEFAGLVDIDPWLIQVDTEVVLDVNLNEGEGTDRVVKAVEGVLSRARQAYAKYEVKGEPFAFIKNNMGTYGMGIMVVRSADELNRLNRREKNKMSVGKNRSRVDSLVVQEGIPTALSLDNNAAEPVVYLMGCDLLGGFIRMNTERGSEDNLNSAGMIFRKLCMQDLEKYLPESTVGKAEGLPKCHMQLVYGSIARLSALAAGLEVAQARGGKAGLA
ncbi:MAG: glutamate--cysteine ligase [Bacteriovoracia bacterium]